MNDSVKLCVYTLFLGAAVVVVVSGCGAESAALAGLTGWDLSACSGNTDVCLELFSDNTEQIGLSSNLITDLLGAL